VPGLGAARFRASAGPRGRDHAFVGSSGITWIHRRALTRKMPNSFYAGEPEVPGFVAEMAKP
jgi:hypothetical protein